MITTGVAGRPWRASITAWGDVVPWDDGPTLSWYVAADDRWHRPADEAAVRQRRVDGTPVVETRVSVPRGDAVQRIWSVADGPGFTVIEVENDSSLPIAVAFDRSDVRTDRPVPSVPIEGIDLPAGSFVLPVGHRATARAAIAHDGSGAGRLPASGPSWEQVVRGWTGLVERAGRYVLPTGDLGARAAETARAERCELVLGSIAHADDDPVAFALGLGELARLGERLDPWLPELAAAVEAVGPVGGWDADVALDAAGRVLHAAGETRALRDLDRIIARRGERAARPDEEPSGVRSVAWLEGRLALDGALFPAGIPTAWLGVDLEVHDVPVGRGSAVSFAVRWHGERPAVLWDVSGDAIELTAPAVDPGWRTSSPSGEALWSSPASVAPVPEGAVSEGAVSEGAVSEGDRSFS